MEGKTKEADNSLIVFFKRMICGDELAIFYSKRYNLSNARPDPLYEAEELVPEKVFATVLDSDVNYKKLTIRNFTICYLRYMELNKSKFFEVLTKLGKTVECLELVSCLLDSKTFAYLLNYFPNLRSLTCIGLELPCKIKNIQLKNDQFPDLSDLISLTIRNMMVLCVHQKNMDKLGFIFWDVLNTATNLEYIECMEGRTFGQDFNSINSFLTRQTKLKELNLIGLPEEAGFLKHDVVDTWNFQLKTLKIRKCRFPTPGIINKFICSQKELEVVIILYELTENELRTCFGKMKIAESLLPDMVSELSALVQEHQVGILNTMVRNHVLGNFVLNYNESFSHIFGLETMRVLKFQLDNYKINADDTFRKINPNLRHLTFVTNYSKEWEDSEIFSKIARAYPEVESLMIGIGLPNYTASDKEIKALNRLPNLKELQCNSFDGRCISMLRLQKLETMGFMNPLLYTNSNLETFCTHHPNLKKLIYIADDINESKINVFLTNLPGLEYFDVVTDRDSNFKLSEQFIRKIISSLPKMKRLRLCGYFLELSKEFKNNLKRRRKKNGFLHLFIDYNNVKRGSEFTPDYDFPESIE